MIIFVYLHAIGSLDIYTIISRCLVLALIRTVMCRCGGVMQPRSLQTLETP